MADLSPKTEALLKLALKKNSSAAELVSAVEALQGATGATGAAGSTGSAGATGATGSQAYSTGLSGSPWAGSDPTSQNAAIDRLAAAVASGATGPIA